LTPTPKVSFIVPVYNVESYLRQSIESILAQSFNDFELILINDGSTDSSGEIIDFYKARDNRIVAIHKPNEGVARTLNLGLSLAKGEWIRRFDSDDTCLPDALEKQFNFLQAHPDVVMVSTQQAFQTEHGKIARHHRMPPNRYFQEQPFRWLKPEDFYAFSPVVHGTALFRRSVVLSLGGYRTGFLTSEDNDLWLRICERHPVAVLNDCSYFLRLHGTSATKRHAASLKFYRELTLRFHEERMATGTDPLQRGDPMPQPSTSDSIKSLSASSNAPGSTYRDDLDFIYRLMVDARDWPLVRRIAGQALRSGWRRHLTYKLLLYPLLGSRLVRTGVRIKSFFRGRMMT
jgi:glycosyltransferase involved in cell wall biosynthesis